MTEEKYGEENPRFRDEFGCVNDLLTGESYLCGSSGFIGEMDAIDTAIALCELLNSLYNENQELKLGKQILRANKKDCEQGRLRERKSFNKFDEMRVKQINSLKEDNRELTIIIDTLKKQNTKLKLKLQDLGVEYI